VKDVPGAFGRHSGARLGRRSPEQWLDPALRRLGVVWDLADDRGEFTRANRDLLLMPWLTIFPLPLGFCRHVRTGRSGTVVADLGRGADDDLGKSSG
jgi:hypothetical protein